jgi:hypothetical protein
MQHKLRNYILLDVVFGLQANYYSYLKASIGLSRAARIAG